MAAAAMNEADLTLQSIAPPVGAQKTYISRMITSFQARASKVCFQANITVKFTFVQMSVQIYLNSMTGAFINFGIATPQGSLDGWFAPSYITSSSYSDLTTTYPYPSDA